MADSKKPDMSVRVEEARDAAGNIAEGLVPMVESSRAAGLDFLAYLLGMALKEARQLSSREDR
jgi:hypothetical protein